MSFFRKHPEHPTRNTNALNAHVSTWSFKQLYETLNSSNDVALLEACHGEYLRRGHAYYVWKQVSQGNIEKLNMEENNAFHSVKGRNIDHNPSTYDLTKWNSDQLKACIETSDDTELLRACRIECNRRITEYERSLGRLELRAMEEIQKLFLKQNQQNEERISRISRASATFDASNPSPGKSTNFIPEVSQLYPKTEPNHRPDKAVESRCFKVSVVGLGQGAYGWWYGHFQGQKICREMEIVGHQPPLLLVEGKDDALMCKLNLNETGLESKIGAGIRLEDFEKEWQKHRTAIHSAKSN